MDRILDLLTEEDSQFISIEKNPKRKNKKVVDDVSVEPLFPDDDDYIDPPHPHLLRIPFSLLEIAVKGSGKTVLLQNVMIWYKELFDNIYIWSPTIKLDKKWKLLIDKMKIPSKNLFTRYREAEVSNLMEQIKQANEALSQKKKIRSLFIMDDMVEFIPKGKKESAINRLAQNHRHYFISHIIISQTFKRLDPILRINTTGVILFNTDNIIERKKIFEELSGNIGVREFERLYMEITSVKFNFMYINYDQRLVYRNFDEVVADLSKPPKQSVFETQEKIFQHPKLKDVEKKKEEPKKD